MLPRLSSIGGFVNPSICAVTPCSADGTYPNGFRVFRMNNNAVNVPSPFQSHQLPGCPPINAPVNTASARMGIARIALAGAHPNHIGIRWC